MVVAALVVHRANGFFMNWGGNQAGEGFEFHILAAAMSLALILGGAGRWSLDRAFTARKR
jgi:putative oxidoreductase